MFVALQFVDNKYIITQVNVCYVMLFVMMFCQNAFDMLF